MENLIASIMSLVLGFAVGWVAGFLRGVRLNKREISLVEAELERLAGLLPSGNGSSERVVVIPSLREQAKRKREVAETELKTPEEWRKENG